METKDAFELGNSRRERQSEYVCTPLTPVQFHEWSINLRKRICIDRILPAFVESNIG